jgi:hypothetical protein
MSDNNDVRVVLPLENDWHRRNFEEDMSWCALDCAWYDDDNLYARPRGITFYIRAHNEENTIAESIQSLHEHLQPRNVPYDIVVIANAITDFTVEKARDALREDDKIVHYTIQVAKPGLENAVTPPNSAHSFVWFTQFALQQCKRYSHAFRWDADFLMTPALADALQREFASPYNVPNDFYSIRAWHRESGKSQREYYLIAVRTRLRYVLSRMWETWWIPCKRPHKATLAGDECIEHVSNLIVAKSYQTMTPWWSKSWAQHSFGSEKWFRDMIAEYEQLHAKLPPTVPTYARSHCNETDILQSYVPDRVKHIEGLPH